MQLVHEEQLDWEAVNISSFDVIICACGYETRAVHLAKKLGGNVDKAMKLAIGFEDRPFLARDDNDQVFRELGYEMCNCNGSAYNGVITAIDKCMAKLNRPRLRVLVDYSSMTRSWYAAVVRYLRDSEQWEEIDVVFAYSPALYSEAPKMTAPNQVAEPLSGFSSLGLPRMGTSLVIGLGYERNRGIGVYQYIEAASAYLFYPDPAFDDKFAPVVRENNKTLISLIPPARVIRYPLDDMQATAAMLSTVCRRLAGNSRVIIAPLGPKPFALISLLLAVRIQGCDIWRVSPGTAAKPSDRVPQGRIVLYSTSWLR